MHPSGCVTLFFFGNLMKPYQYIISITLVLLLGTSTSPIPLLILIGIAFIFSFHRKEGNQVDLITTTKSTPHPVPTDRYELSEITYNTMFISREERNKYLASPQWKELKQTKLRQSYYICQVCGTTKKLELHHLTYERLTKERLEDVVILCRHCHQLQHDTYGLSRDTIYLPIIRK